MTRLTLRLDMRAPTFANTGDDFYRVALDMAQWADEQGFAECMLSEHHGSDDGYLPSPLVLGAAIAARTQHLRIRISALVLPLHDPLRIAEDVAVLDHISGGRAELVVAGGFVPSEFAMFSRDLSERGRLVEEGIATLRKAWTGEPFDYQGKAVRVTPRPLQQPAPPILLGGSSSAAARRAARIAEGFVPAVPELYPLYVEACEEFGVQPGEARALGPMAVFVADDPDAFWERLAPHVLHETNAYARWYAQTDALGAYVPVQDVGSLRESGIYQVLTPEECLKLAAQLGEHGWLFIQPLLGGLDPELGWEMLELLRQEVLPALA